MKRTICLILALLVSFLLTACSSNESRDMRDERLKSGIKYIENGDYDKATQELAIFAEIPADKMTIRDREGHDLYYYASAKKCRIKGDYTMYGFYLDMIPNAYDRHFAKQVRLELKRGEGYRNPQKYEKTNELASRFYKGNSNLDSSDSSKDKQKNDKQKEIVNEKPQQTQTSVKNKYEKPLAHYGDYAKDITNTDYAILYSQNGKRIMLYTEGGSKKTVTIADEALVNKIKSGKASDAEIHNARTVGVAYSFKYEDHLVYAKDGIPYVMIINPIDNWVYLYTGVKTDGSYSKFEELDVIKLEGYEK